MVNFPIEQSDAYEEMGLCYQAIELARLNEVLEQHNVAKELREKICGAYFFDHGYFLDAGSFRLDGKRLFPTLCFAERKVDPHQGILEFTKLYLPSQHYSFHESSDGDLESEDHIARMNKIELL